VISQLYQTRAARVAESEPEWES